MGQTAGALAQNMAEAHHIALVGTLQFKKQNKNVHL